MTAALEMSEAELQSLVRDAADLHGWLTYHTHDSRRSDAGFPDLVMLRGRYQLVVECKSATGRLRPDQVVWMDSFAKVDTIASAVVRPADAVAMIERLGRTS